MSERIELGGEKTYKELVLAQEAMPEGVVVAIHRYLVDGDLHSESLITEPSQIEPKHWPFVVSGAAWVKRNKKPGKASSYGTRLRAGNLFAEEPSVHLCVYHADDLSGDIVSLVVDEARQ